jgi:hypothetical protein
MTGVAATWQRDQETASMMTLLAIAGRLEIFLFLRAQIRWEALHRTYQVGDHIE